MSSLQRVLTGLCINLSDNVIKNHVSTKGLTGLPSGSESDLIHQRHHHPGLILLYGSSKNK